MRKRNLTMGLVLPAMLALTACGGGAEDDGVASAGGGAAKGVSASPSQSLSPEDARLKFAQCMRENGVEMTDPGSGGEMRVQVTGKPMDREKTQAAMSKCQPYLEAGGKMPNMQDPKVRDQMVKFAQCMREHGVDMPDPGPDGSLMIRGKAGAGGREQVEKARKACASLRPGGGQR